MFYLIVNQDVLKYAVLVKAEERVKFRHNAAIRDPIDGSMTALCLSVVRRCTRIVRRVPAWDQAVLARCAYYPLADTDAAAAGRFDYRLRRFMAADVDNGRGGLAPADNLSGGTADMIKERMLSLPKPPE